MNPDFGRIPGQGIEYGFLLAGNSKIDEVARDPESSWKMNVEGNRKVLSFFRRHSIFPVFFSTDHVYPGLAGNHGESCEGAAVNLYGQQKRRIEETIQEQFKEYCILRLPKVVGMTDVPGEMLMELHRGLTQRQEVKLIEFQVFQILSMQDLLGIVRHVLDQRLSGTFNAATPERVTRLTLLQRMARLANIAELRYRQLPQAEFGFADRRPQDSSMNVTKFLEATGFRFQSVDEILNQFLQERRRLNPA